MISAGDFRNGVTFEEDGNVLQVIEFQHVKPGKGAAFVRTKQRLLLQVQQLKRVTTHQLSTLLHTLKEKK